MLKGAVGVVCVDATDRSISISNLSAANYFRAQIHWISFEINKMWLKSGGGGVESKGRKDGWGPVDLSQNTPRHSPVGGTRRMDSSPRYFVWITQAVDRSTTGGVNEIGRIHRETLSK